MELTLLPLTAILLLLSGVAVPRYDTVGGQLSAGVFVRFWFLQELSDAECVTAVARRRKRNASGQRGLWGARCILTLTPRARFALRTFVQACLRTRFGVASGAYQPLAPPLLA